MKLFDVRQKRLPDVLRKLTPPTFKRLEKHVMEQCVSLLRRKNYYPYRLDSGRFWTLDKQRIVHVGETGIPDFIVIHKKYPAFFMETKRAVGGVLGGSQKNKIWELREAYGITVMVADSYEALSQWLIAYEIAHEMPYQVIPKAEDWMAA